MLKCLIPLLIAAAAAPALAQDAAPPAATRISYADLNLGRPEGRATLDRRLRHAARQLCPGKDVRTLTEQMQARACVALTLRSARQLAAAAMASSQPEVLLASAAGDGK